MTADNAWWHTLIDVSREGVESSPRGLKIFEILRHQLSYQYEFPIVTHCGRKLNLSFMFAEAHWVLSGSRHLSDIAPYGKFFTKYSDDGRTLSGAYGPPFISQVRYIIDTLRADSDSRQAVLTIWEQRPRQSLDIPCTISMQFLIRASILHSVVCMRSSDAWMGLPYDLFTFAMMTQYVRLLLQQRLERPLQQGTCTIFAGSRHIYEEHLPLASRLSSSPPVVRDYLSIKISSLKTPDDLLTALGVFRNAPESILV